MDIMISGGGQPREVITTRIYWG